MAGVGVDGGGGDARRDAAAAVWSAAADARLWAASIHGKAARAEHKRAWDANAEVDAALMRAARLLEGAAKARGGIDAAAVAGRAAAEFGEAAEAAVQTSAALARMSRLGRLEAGEEEKAAEAYAGAADAERERAARRTASASLKLALTASDWSPRAAADVRVSRQLADMWAANAAERNGGCELGGGHGDWAEQWAGLRADCEQDTAKSAEMAEEAAAREGEAARELRQAAAAAERSAAAATAAVADMEADRGRYGPDMQAAVAAWKEAVSAAGRAKEEDGAAGRTG